jgi:hypothetical protein
MSEQKRIIEDMQKTGFPLEIVAGTRFIDKNWKVRPQEAFYDEDERKSRKIDFIAHKALAKNFQSFRRLIYTTVVECKKSDKPWVFYTPRSSLLREKKDLATVFYMKVISKPSLPPLKIQSLFAHNHYVAKEPTDRIAQASYIAFTGGEEGKDQIFTAINQVLKALRYIIAQSKSHFRYHIVQGLLEVYYPVVVFDGKMYECVLSKGIPQLREAKYVKFETSFLAASQEIDNEKTPERFLIDFVTKDFLPTYIDWLDDEINILLG